MDQYWKSTVPAWQPPRVFNVQHEDEKRIIIDGSKEEHHTRKQQKDETSLCSESASLKQSETATYNVEQCIIYQHSSQKENQEREHNCFEC